jgi:phage terminase large subunit-like protein
MLEPQQPDPFEGLSPKQLQAALAGLKAEKSKRQSENKLAAFKAYKKQREFFSAGKTHRERLLMAANRFGKTECGAAEMAFHLTGLYPKDWPGKRFDKPVRAWAAGVTSETTRDVVQTKLIGPPFDESQWGTGMIPKSCLAGIAPARGIPSAIDTVSVKQVNGGMSSLQFKSFERGREKWQGAACEVIWFDEECPADIYSEGLTRTNETGGIVFITFTPLDGVTEVVRRFLHEKNDDRHVTQATIDDAPHFSAADKKRIVASYLPHEAEARIKGVPVLGSGRIFPIPEESIICDPIQNIPDWWVHIGALDFGYEHPAAAVHLVWDRDCDCVYVTKAWREKHTTPILHAAALKSWGDIEWAWPRDGRRETLEGAGIPLMRQYATQGLNMLSSHAAYDDGTPGGNVSVEAGLMDMLDRMQTGRLNVYSNLNDWFEEFRLYHRKDGKVFKEHDDLMAATRYGIMSLRHARKLGARRGFNRALKVFSIGAIV